MDVFAPGTDSAPGISFVPPSPTIAIPLAEDFKKLMLAVPLAGDHDATV